MLNSKFHCEKENDAVKKRHPKAEKEGVEAKLSSVEAMRIMVLKHCSLVKEERQSYSTALCSMTVMSSYLSSKKLIESLVFKPCDEVVKEKLLYSLRGVVSIEGLADMPPLGCKEATLGVGFDNF
uniref:Uncharacterized protein n=1 Tax=Cucumis melo TaxID=3656 RepID=A0A9I9E7I2_CUCME